jgi:hypothetical protein
MRSKRRSNQSVGEATPPQPPHPGFTAQEPEPVIYTAPPQITHREPAIQASRDQLQSSEASQQNQLLVEALRRAEAQNRSQWIWSSIQLVIQCTLYHRALQTQKLELQTALEQQRNDYERRIGDLQRQLAQNTSSQRSPTTAPGKALSCS